MAREFQSRMIIASLISMRRLQCHLMVKFYFLYTYEVDERSFHLDTRELREILEGVPFSEPQVSAFIRSFLDENQEAVDKGEIMEER